MINSDPYESELVKSCDRFIYQTLNKIIRENRPTSIDQIKSIIKPILKKELIIGKRFSKTELDSLSLLWIAVLSYLQDSAELLVRSGADVNEVCGLSTLFSEEFDKTSTVLHELLEMYPSSWNERFIDLIINLGADFEAQLSDGKAVLHCAIIQQRVQLTKMLLKKGANVNVTDSYNRTPLFEAARSSKADELVPLLLQYGANVSVKDKKAHNALHYLAKAPDDVKHVAELTRVFIEKGVSLHDRTRQLEYPIHLAVRDGKNSLLIKTFIENGANVNVTNFKGQTPLLLAASSDKADELVPLLLRYGADIFAKDKKGYNALHYLAHSPGESVELAAKLLIEKGVSLSDRAADLNNQLQPIHLAAKNGKSKLIQIYLDHGADVNARGRCGVFPLWLAANNEDPKALKTLLGYGANVHLYYENNTTLHLACKQNLNDKIIRLLLAAGANFFAETLDSDKITPLPCVLNANMVFYSNTLSVELMIKELALKKDLLMPTFKDEWSIIYFKQMWWDYYRECIVNVDRMKFTRLTKSCTFFDLLTKNHCEIAAFMRNPDFEANFELYNLEGFSMYAKDLRRALERARKHYQSMLEEENVINESFYNLLPYVVMRKVVDNLFEDTYCCLDAIY